MRKPFVISNGIQKPLTDIQSRRRGRLLTRTKTYQEYLLRQRLKTRRSPGQRKVLPKALSLFLRHNSLENPEISLLTEAIETLDGGSGKPTQQLMLELEIWTRSHRRVMESARKESKSKL